VGFFTDLAARDAFLYQLSSEGATVSARLTDKSVETTTDFPVGARGSRSTRDSVLTRYAYRFETPDGDVVAGSASVLGRLPSSVTTVRVYYLPDEPQRHAVFSAVEQKRLGFNGDTLAGALLFCLSRRSASSSAASGFGCFAPLTEEKRSRATRRTLS